MRKYNCTTISRELRMLIGAIRKVLAETAPIEKLISEGFDHNKWQAMYCFSDDIGRGDFPTFHPNAELVDLQDDLIPAQSRNLKRIASMLEKGAVWKSGPNYGERVVWKGVTLSESVFCFIIFNLTRKCDEFTLNVPKLKGIKRQFWVVETTFDGKEGVARFRRVTINYSTRNAISGQQCEVVEQFIDKERFLELDKCKNDVEPDYDDYECDDYDDLER